MGVTAGRHSTPAGSATAFVLVLFFGFATAFCLIAGVTILVPETALSGIWQIKPEEFTQLLAFRPWSGIGFLLLSCSMAIAAWGCFHNKRWGWRLAVAIFTAHALGDVVQILAGGVVEGAIGITVVGAILLWLTRPQVKAEFK
jgi:hypothetical protein